MVIFFNIELKCVYFITNIEIYYEEGKKAIMKKGCMYWLFIGFWLEPMIWIFKISFYIIKELICEITNGIETSFLRENKYNNIDFDLLDGHEFEYFCADLLRDNGFTGVKVTQGSGDHGIDILANKDGRKYAIQCKCYSKNVGNAAVQQAYSGNDIYNSDIAVVMTNRFFTPQAIQDARKLSVVLWDRKKLMDFVRHAKGENNSQKNNQNLATFSNTGENEIDKKRKEIQFELDKINSQNETFDIFDVEEKIIRLKDGEISKVFFQYIDSVSRIAIDFYLQTKSDNEYTNEMNKCVEQPICFYNAEYSAMDMSIRYVYYCKIKDDFRNTAAYSKLEELAKQRGKKYDNDLFQIDVYFSVDDISLVGKNIKINKQPQVSISTSKMEDLRELEEIHASQALYRNLPLHNYVTEKSFFAKMDNMKFNAVEEEPPKKIEIDEKKIEQTGVEIYRKFVCFGIKVEILEVNFDGDNIIFCIRQEQGVRVKTIMSYKPDISLAIGAECEMRLISEKGCIGISVPAKYFIKTF